MKIRLIKLFAYFVLIVCLFSCQQHSSKNNSEDQENTDRWYMNTIMYNVDVHVFKDSNGDGVGDFNGLTQELGYLQSLGVNTIWLAPFQPSPYKDDGYDVTDYFGIDPKVGTKQDFDHFIQEAKRRHIKVLMDLILNHTSIQSAWYQQARADTGSKYFNWYVWSKKRPKNYDKGMAFPGVQSETWTYDEIAKHYYFHRFYDFQPDLNYENTQVQAESMKVIQYWLKAGLDGFRLDAVPFIIDEPEKGDNKQNEMFFLLSNFYNEARRLKPDAILLGEANVPPKESKDYFGDHSSRLQMMFNFYANQFLFYSLADENTAEFKNALEKTHEKPPEGQWAWFLRNHDEIDLGRLSGKQRDEVYKAMGPEKNMQLYKRGIRRRLAPMINNPAKLKLCYALLYSLPGTPVIRYGEELGMGEDLTLAERLAVRTPMQWSAQPNAGFTSSNNPYRAVISSGDYSFRKINEEAEEKDPNSLLNTIKDLIRTRRQCPEIGLGSWKVLDAGTNKALCLQYSLKGKSLITVYNFSKDNISTKITPLKIKDGSFTGLLNAKERVTLTGGKLNINLKPYGYQWYKAD